ncbi:MAG TPA: serine hydrolase [Streptosporangiaceae bacterium]|nr:serine hydrolase [Streptosporangiaceae bacterium]
MRGTRRPPKTMLTAAVCAAAIGAATTVPLAVTATTAAAANTTSICTSAAHPYIAGKISAGLKAALAARPGSHVGLAISDPAHGLNCQLHSSDHFYAASVVKVTILSALLLKVGGPSHLTATQRNLAFQMITQSSNSAANTLWAEVGVSHVQDFLNKAGMGQTVLNSGAWGLTRITAHDELRLLQVLTNSTVLSSASRGYVLTLMSEVIASERWGVSAGAPTAEQLHIKNGWLPYPGAADWNINSIGAFTGPNNYQMVILTAPPSGGTQSESYGIQTIQAAAIVFNRDLALWSHVSNAIRQAATPGASALHAPGG